MSKTAEEVVEEIFARGASQEELEKVSGALMQLWEEKRWSADAIDRTVEGLRGDS